LKIAIIGYGSWGKKLYREYCNILGNENVIIHDPPQGMVYSEWNTINGVHIATPPHTHFDIAKKFLEMRIPVLIEKPMCLRSSECLKLIDLSRKNRTILMLGHIYRYSDAFNKIKKTPQKSMKLVWKHTSRATNVIWDLLPHVLDICNIITGVWPEKLRAVHNDKNAFLIGYVNNIPLSIDLSLNYDGKIRDLIIDDERFPIIEMQTNNTIRSEALEFIHYIGHKVSTPLTDGFLGYITCKLIEDVLRYA